MSVAPPVDSKTPRVLVDGPGGAEVKQGARIACDNCRQAKIKCSSPTDGQVPCARCLKTQKPCLFYKHQRGRKPGRLNNRKKDANASATATGANGRSSDNEEDDDDDEEGGGDGEEDDATPLASTSSLAYSTPTSAKPAKVNESRSVSGSSTKNAASSKSRQLSLSASTSAPLSHHHYSQVSPAPIASGLTGKKRKRHSAHLTSAGSAASFAAHADPIITSSPNFHSPRLARAPSPALSRTSTVGSTGAALHHGGKRAGSVSALGPPALLQRTSLSASGSGSGTGSRSGSRHGSGSPAPLIPGSPSTKRQQAANPSAHHGHQGGRHASPEELALAANSLLWYSSAAGTGLGNGAPTDRSQSSHHGGMQTSASTNSTGINAYNDFQNPALSQSSHHYPQPVRDFGSLVEDFFGPGQSALLSPSQFLNEYSHLDAERQRLLMPLYLAATGQAQTGPAPEWQKLLQQQMQQASYDPSHFPAAAAAVQQISNVIQQQAQQHQQHAVQQLLAKSSSVQSMNGSAHGPPSSTAPNGAGHITIPAHPPHASVQSYSSHAMHLGMHAASSGPTQQRSTPAISTSVSMGASGAASKASYPNSARNGTPTSAPLPGMSDLLNHFGYPTPASSNVANTSAAQQGIMAPPPPRHSASFHGFESGHTRLHHAGPGAALHVGTSGGGRSGSFSEAVHASGRALGQGQGPSSHIYDGASGVSPYGQGPQQAGTAPQQLQQQQHHYAQHAATQQAQMHLTGGKVGAVSMPPFVHGARGVNRPGALKSEHSPSLNLGSPGIGSGTNPSPAPGETSRESGTPTGLSGVADGGPLSRLRSLSNESGQGSAGSGPSMKRARLEGNVAEHPPRPVDEENKDDVVEDVDGADRPHDDGGEEEEVIDEGDDEEYDDDDDDDDEEEETDAESESHVLSNPLRLLAHASGAAALMDSGATHYQKAAETMGLLCVRRDEGAEADTRSGTTPYEGPVKRESPLDYYRRHGTTKFARSLTSPRNRPSDMSSLPSLVRNPPGSTAASGVVASASATGKHMYRPSRPITDDPTWILGPRRLTSGVAALVGSNRLYMRPGGLPLPDGPAYRATPPALPSSMSDSGIGSEGRGPSGFLAANGLASSAARRDGGSASGSVHDDDGALGGGALGEVDDHGRSQFPRRAGLSFESSASRTTGGRGGDDEVMSERGAGLRRSILSDTRRTSVGAGLGISPRSPVQQTQGQPTPMRPADLLRPDNAEDASAAHAYSQPEPLRKDDRHGVVTAESLLGLERESGEAPTSRKQIEEWKDKQKEAQAETEGGVKAPPALVEDVVVKPTPVAPEGDKMEVDPPEAGKDPVAVKSVRPSRSASAGDGGITSVLSALGKTTPDVSMDAPSSVHTPERSGPAPRVDAAVSSADKSTDNPSLSPAMSPPVRRRRFSLSIDTPKDGTPYSGGVFPSPHQQEYFEYKDGQAQLRTRPKGGSVSSGTGVPFQSLHLLPGLGVRGGKAHTVAGGLTPAMKPASGPITVPSPSPAGDGELLPPPLLPRSVAPLKKAPKSWVSFGGLESSPLHHSFGVRRRPKDKKEKDRMKKKRSTAGMTDMSGRSKTTMRTRLNDDGKDDILPNMDDADSDDGFKSGYFNCNIYQEKLDNDFDSADPVEHGYVELREVERLFDVFINHINPLLLVFDPMLHSVHYVRSRSAFLTTVIISLAARFVDTQRDAALAVTLSHVWLDKQLPRILCEGFKSIEIAQAFIVLAMFHKPSDSLADDRSWQYLGFAIRIATEIGVNRRLGPREGVRTREPMRRRERNRERLWCNLFLCDRVMSAQTGRPWTISDDLLRPELSRDWHTQDCALPADAVVVHMIRLRRTCARHITELDSWLSKEHASLGTSTQALSYLEFLRQTALTDLERWRDSWSETKAGAEPAGLEATDSDWGPFSTHWTPISKLYYHHACLHLNSFVLQAIEKYDQLPTTAPTASKVSKDSWNASLEVVKITLGLGDGKLMYAPNHLIVMAVYAAISMLRLLNRDKVKNPWLDREEAISAVRSLIKALNSAGKTPQHRNGAAVPYAKVLTSVLALWDPPTQTEAPTQPPVAEEAKKSKDPPRATSPNRNRSQSDAAAMRVRPQHRDVPLVSNNAIVMPANAPPRDRKGDRNSLGSAQPSNTATSIFINSSISPARPATSAANPTFGSMAFSSSVPLGTPEGTNPLTTAQSQSHPHPIDFDSVGAWAGGVANGGLPTSDAFGLSLQRATASAPISSLSTPAIGADTSADLSASLSMDAPAQSGTAQSNSALGAPFMSLTMPNLMGLNLPGVNMPSFLLSRNVAPSTSSTAAAAPSSAGPTMMRQPHQQRQSGTGFLDSVGGLGTNVIGNQSLDEAFFNFGAPNATAGAVAEASTAGDDGERDRLWDYLSGFDSSGNGVTNGFWPPQQASWNSFS